MKQKLKIDVQKYQLATWRKILPLVTLYGVVIASSTYESKSTLFVASQVLNGIGFCVFATYIFHWILTNNSRKFLLLAN